MFANEVARTPNRICTYYTPIVVCELWNCGAYIPCLNWNLWCTGMYCVVWIHSQNKEVNQLNQLEKCWINALDAWDYFNELKVYITWNVLNILLSLTLVCLFTSNAIRSIIMNSSFPITRAHREQQIFFIPFLTFIYCDFILKFFSVVQKLKVSLNFSSQMLQIRSSVVEFCCRSYHIDNGCWYLWKFVNSDSIAKMSKSTECGRRIHYQVLNNFSWFSMKPKPFAISHKMHFIWFYLIWFLYLQFMRCRLFVLCDCFAIQCISFHPRHMDARWCTVPFNTIFTVW